MSSSPVWLVETSRSPSRLRPRRPTKEVKVKGRDLNIFTENYILTVWEPQRDGMRWYWPLAQVCSLWLTGWLNCIISLFIVTLSSLRRLPHHSLHHGYTVWHWNNTIIYREGRVTLLETTVQRESWRWLNNALFSKRHSKYYVKNYVGCKLYKPE